MPEWLKYLLTLFAGVIFAFIPALIAAITAFILYQRRKADEKNRNKVKACNDVIKSAIMVRKIIFLLQSKSIEFRYHEHRFKTSSNEFEEKFMIINKHSFDEINIRYFELCGELVESINTYEFYFGHDKIVMDEMKKIESLIIDRDPHEYRDITPPKLHEFHENKRREVDELVRNVLEVPYKKIGERMVEKLNELID